MTKETKRKRLILIDGHAIIHRAFHAVPEDLSTSAGEPVNATFGFTSMLMKALLEEKPDYIAVTFDRPSPTFRHTAYAPYKAHRPALPDNLRSQFARIREVVHSFGIQIYEKDGFEADDVLGTLSVQARQLDVMTIIYTGDMDTLQLVNDQVMVKVAKRGISEVVEYDEAEVQQRYGFTPDKLPDFKGLIGDKSDNIPGVPGVGEKTASRLLNEYGDLEGVLAHVDELKPKEQKLLREFADQARQSKYLATIVLDAPVQLDLASCRMTHVKTEDVVTLFRQLEFRTLIERALSLFRQLGLSSAAIESSVPDQRASDEQALVADLSPEVEQESLLYAPPLGVVPILLPPISPTTHAINPVRAEAAAVSPSSPSVPPPAEEPLQLSLFDVEVPHTEVVRKLRLPDPATPASALFVEDNRPGQTNTLIVDTEEGLRVLVQSLRNAGRFALDTETTSDDPHHSDLVGISFAMAPGEAYYLPVGHGITPDGQEPGPQLPLPLVVEKLRPVLEDASLQKYMHNAKYDLAIFARVGLHVQGLAFDTMLGAYLADPGRRGVGLKDQAFQRLGVVMTPISELIGTGSKMISMSQVPIRKAADYAGSDADMTFRLVEPIEEELRQHNLLDLYYRIELPLIHVLMQMEMYGVALDADFLSQFGEALEDQLTRLEELIFSDVGHRFNINSPKQLAVVLFEELKLPTGKKTKTGYSVNADVIDSLRGKHPVADHLSLYRQLTKLKSTYVDGLLLLVDKQTGRVHTSFNQTIASSGRLSSSNPNLQNIPVRTDLGRQIRRAFIADPSYLLLTADYSQFELRILAHIIGDPRLVEAFKSDEDIHKITAASLFNVPVEEVTKDQRRLAKTVVYATLYGQSAFGLSQVTGMTNAESADFIRRYHETFPSIKGYVDSTLQQARSQGYVNTLYGRKRFFPEMHALSHTERQALEREAINMPIQGTNADLIKIAMLRIQHDLYAQNLKTRMILQVHDELVFEVPVEEVERVQPLIKERMEGVAELNVPIKIEMKLGRNWYEAEPVSLAESLVDEPVGLN
ncbi:DNA polymerase I [Tengunoibacter tsumagoiensis]|uniref:DNA polymerase I n=1 Tax=Tengunoibacter tsumagoiensis TaxID=2014871 RepID=A0A402A2G3_9CHLR|nr:DNA polymerase I [Tengunoibacter tsumagoiensis]GCE13239.1 DNA polymerase I [Tengunoibacter tsumagoiensis]